MIRRNTDNFTGFILQGEEKVFFHAQEKVFYFIAEGAGLFADDIKRNLLSPDHFFYGYTSDGYQVALYTGYDKREISVNYRLRPGLYLVSRANLCRYDMSKFQAVEFVGGTLNNLYGQEHIRTEYDDGKKCYIKTYPESRTEYTVKIRDYECKLIIKNIPSYSNFLQIDVVIRYEFQEEVPLIEIKTIYNVLTDICKFMTNRKNVGFDEIKLFQLDKETTTLVCFADAFIDYRYNEFTKKLFGRNILFSHLKDYIINLHTIISSNTEGIPTYLFDFYADSDTDYNVFTGDKIKNICSSIECELNFIKDLKDEENKNLDNLIRDIKAVIKTHRKSENKLEEKTYDLISGSMSNWGMANSRKIYLLYERNKPYMDIFKSKRGLSCTEEDIVTFVKFRNDVTHGRYRTIDSVVVATSFTLMSLSYCCFLRRIGMQEKELKKLFEENRIGS